MLRLLFLLPLIIIQTTAMAVFLSVSALAEVVPDITLPESSRVDRQRNIRRIEGGTRRGANLFHSFRQFSVPQGQTASFQGVDSSVTNLFTRVTGSRASRIDGRIQVLQTDGSVSPANLFLLNPNGIVFGPNASLNVGGAFLATTANSINFADGTQFSAVNPQTFPLLTLSVPVGLQFGSNPQPITNRSPGLQVRNGETLALVGGQINLLSGRATSQGGRIELGAVGGNNIPTQVTFTNNTLALNYQNVQNFQDIRFADGAIVDASGESGGSIQIRGRNVVLTDVSSIRAGTQGSEPGGTIDVGATQSIILRDGSNIATFASGKGRAGDVFLRASDSVQVLGTIKQSEQERPAPSAIGSQVTESAIGGGGNVTIETSRLIARNGGVIEASTFGRGQAGNIVVRGLGSQYADSVELSGARRYSLEDPTEIRDRIRSGIFAQVAEGGIDEAGDAGSITINTRELNLLGGAQVSSAARTNGRGGNITINAPDSVTINGRSPDATETVGRSGIFVSAEKGARNNAGQLDITTRELTVENQGEISANNFGPAQGGTINIDVDQLTVQSGSDIRATSVLDEGIEGEGLAGNINITADFINLDQGRLTAETDAGGTPRISNANIRIQSPTALVIQNQSQISARAILNARGGNVTILAPDGFVVATNRNNDIRADAVGGQGGNITIEAQSILGLAEQEAADGNNTNDIDASSDFGLSGTVTLNTPDVDPSRGLAELPIDLIDASGLIAQNCLTSSTVASTQSEFVITGRSGLPPSPTDPRSPEITDDWVTLDETEAQTESRTVVAAAPAPPAEIVEAQGWIRDANGAVTLVAEAPISPQTSDFAQRCSSTLSRN